MLTTDIICVKVGLINVYRGVTIVSVFKIVKVLFMTAVLSRAARLSAGFCSGGGVLTLCDVVTFSLSTIVSIPRIIGNLRKSRGNVHGTVTTNAKLGVKLVLLVAFVALLKYSGIARGKTLISLSNCLNK